MNVTDGEDHESSGLDIEEEENIDLSSDEECNRYGFVLNIIYLYTPSILIIIFMYYAYTSSFS